MTVMSIRSGTANLVHETGTSLQRHWSSGGRFITPGHTFTTEQPKCHFALESWRGRKQPERRDILQSFLGFLHEPRSTDNGPFQRFHPRLDL